MCKIMENEDPILEIKSASYTYEGETIPVWEDLSYTFQKGKLHAISGPSGCGKSSVLYFLDGLIPHMYEGKLSGKLYLKGKDITDRLPRERCEDIGFVMQNPESQFCTFTVEEELAFGMENLGLSWEEMSYRMEKALDYVGMSGYEAFDLTQLSGGQKQKIAIASILVMEPEILLLDEPTANLDPESRKEIFALISRLTKEMGMTIVLVEHNLEEILEHVDCILMLDGNGKVIASGEGEDVERLFMDNQVVYEQKFFHTPEDISTEEVVLKIQNLQFAYPEPGKKSKSGNRKIIDGLNLELRKQELLAIVGENGVGKTTLMRLLFRIFEQDKGDILLFGKPVESYKKKELYHQIGLVFQNPENQFITNTVEDEMMFSLKKVKISEQEKKSRINEMLHRFHLEGEMEKSPFVLSQGQKRRLSVASMLLTEQKILFLDEPTYGQDFENRHELMKDMCSLIHDGITIVMITHDLSLVRQYATRVVEIGEGKVVRSLSTEEYFLEKENNRCLHI